MTEETILPPGVDHGVDAAIIRVLTQALNDLIEAHEAGTLDKRAIMKARSMLPAGYSMTLTKKDR